MWVRFTKEVFERQSDGDLHFKAGQTVKLKPPSANRWIRRGVAVAVGCPQPQSETETHELAEPSRKRRGRPKAVSATADGAEAETEAASAAPAEPDVGVSSDDGDAPGRELGADAADEQAPASYKWPRVDRRRK